MHTTPNYYQPDSKSTKPMNFKKPASVNSVEKTMEALKGNQFIPFQVNTKKEALKKIMELIPDGSTVMNGASETLREIGYTDLLKSGKHNWKNLHDAIIAEQDPVKQSEIRRNSVNSEYYVGSAHTVTEDGEIIIASNSGSQLPHLVFTSPNLILVVGSQKITANLTEGFRRLREHVIPLEDIRMQGVYGIGTTHAKTVILHKENPMMGRKVFVIFVNESLGF